MGNYDRTHNQWRMMQQRHSSSLNNPYFSGGYIAGNSDRRASGLQPLCNPNTTTTSNNNDAASASTNYYNMGGDDRTAPHKRSRLTVNTSAAGLRANDYSKMNRGDSPNSGGGGMDTPRLAGLVSYLSPSAESLSQYSYQHQGVDGYGGPGPSGVPSAIGSSGQEMNSDWFAQRGLSSSLGVSAAPQVNSYTTSSEMASVSGTGLSRQSSLASPTTIFGMENLMADYESGFYSLWNQPNGGNVMGYDADAPSDRQPSNVETGHVYMPEEELKMDYPQLPDLNQGDLDYIYGSMDTPTATRGGEPPMDRSYGSSVKRDRPSDENKTFTGMMSPSQSGLLSPLALSGFRNLARNTTIETKRPAAARSHASSSSYLGVGGPSATSKPTSSPHLTAKKAHTPTTPVSASSPSPSSSKRPRSRQCDFPGCDNRARSHQKCKKHGGAHQCMFEGCLKNSQSRGLCIAHGGGSRCKVDGCTRAAQSKGLCKSHGGGEFCAVEGCRKKAHLKHLCRTHGGGVRCKDTKCMKWAQRKGWCMAHAKLVLDP